MFPVWHHQLIKAHWRESNHRLRKTDPHTCPADTIAVEITKTCSKSVHPYFIWKLRLLLLLGACCVINSGDSKPGFSPLVTTWTAASVCRQSGMTMNHWNSTVSLLPLSFLVSVQQKVVSASGIPGCGVTHAPVLLRPWSFLVFTWTLSLT